MTSPSLDLDRGCVGRPKITHRKSSFSDAFDKFTKTKPFNRRRTTTLTASASSVNFASQPASRLPTPAGIPKSTSFFGALGPRPNHFSNIKQENEPPLSSFSKRPRKISDRLAQSSFFTHHDPSLQQQRKQSVQMQSNSNRRNSKVTIEQRGLMQPVHPPLPKSKTLGNLDPVAPDSQAPNLTSSMSSCILTRANSQSTHSRRQSNVLSPLALRSVNSPSEIPRPVTHGQQRRTTTYTVRKDSLYSPPGGVALPQHQSPERTDNLPAAMTTSPSDHEWMEIYQEYHQRVADYDSTSPPTDRDTKAEQAKVNTQISSPSEQEQSSPPSAPEDLKENVAVASDSASRASESDASNVGLVHTSKPPSYWLGRYTALSDRFRSSALPSLPSPPSTPPASENDKAKTGPEANSKPDSYNANHPMHDPQLRNRRALSHLRSVCTTKEANDSLDLFIELKKEREKGMRGKTEDGGIEIGKVKKKWLDGLMGRKKTT